MFKYDVFLSHSSADKVEVEAVAKELANRGIRVFFDVWELVPGTHWQDALVDALAGSQTVAVLLGPGAELGPWHTEEMRVALGHRAENKPKRVIPVLLPGADSAAIPEMLAQRTWVDLREGPGDQVAFERLVAGIRGSAPSYNQASAADFDDRRPPERGSGTQHRTPAARSRWLGYRLFSLAVLIGVLGFASATVFWIVPPPRPAPTSNSESRAKPDLYSVRVQVTDPIGRPVDDSKLRVSVGNEPHLLPDGWWQIEVPRTKLPLNGGITLWAEHTRWKGARKDLVLGADPNPRTEIQLEVPRERIAGVVVDAGGAPIANARISVLDHLGESTISDQAGRFSKIWVEAARNSQARVRVEHADFQPRNGTCLAGRDGCVLVLEP